MSKPDPRAVALFRYGLIAVTRCTALPRECGAYCYAQRRVARAEITQFIQPDVSALEM